MFIYTLFQQMPVFALMLTAIVALPIVAVIIEAIITGEWS